jgi:hypothetical protein
LSYGATGDWARLFRGSEEYLGTQLLQDTGSPGRFLTLDWWHSRQAFERFKKAHADEYRALDDRCAGFTKTERHVGDF